jgi:molybdopterin converting factor small subunit
VNAAAVFSPAGDEEAAAAPIVVRLFGGLGEQLPAAPSRIELKASQAHTVAEVLDAIGLPAGVAGLVLINGLHGTPESGIAAGDLVALFPHLNGG